MGTRVDYVYTSRQKKSWQVTNGNLFDRFRSIQEKRWYIHHNAISMVLAEIQLYSF